MLKPHTLIALFLFITLSGFSNYDNLSKNSIYKMSNIVLKFIPATPNFVPDKANQDKAKSFLANIFKGDNIEFKTTDEIEFVDQGSNFEGVFCN